MSGILLNMSLSSIMLCRKAMIIHESIAVWMRDMSGKGYIPLFYKHETGQEKEIAVMQFIDLKKKLDV